MSSWASWNDGAGEEADARMAARIIFDDRGHDGVVEDVPRAPIPGEPPEAGAQWDEVHRRWERWDDDAGAWVIVGDPGDGVAPEDEQREAEARRLVQGPIDPATADVQSRVPRRDTAD